MPNRNRGRVSAAASFFGFRAHGRPQGGARAEDRRDEREPEGRRAAAPEHGDDGVPADQQFSERCDRAEDDDYMQYDDPHDDDGMPESRRRARRARRAEEDGYGRYEDEDGGEREGRRADAEDGDPDEEEEDRQDREGRARRSARRARADEGDEDDDEAEMRGRSPAAAARRRERARCEAILTSRAAAANPELAFSLAFETSMTRQEALRTLARAPAAPAAGGGRSARNPNIGAGGERAPNSAQAIQAGWDRAFAKVGATKPPADNGWDRAFAGQH